MSPQTRLHAVNSDSWIAEPDGPLTAPDPATNSAAGGTTPPGGASGSATGRAQKQRSDRSLPTDRLSFDKQVEVLKAIAQLSGAAKKPVTAGDLSAAIGLAPTSGTGGLSNKFFRDTGWIVSAGRGNYAATDALMEYFRHVNIDPQDVAARRHLVVPARTSWYWEALEPVLSGGGTRKSIVLLTLSKAAGAHEHTVQLDLIVTWLEWLGMVRRDGDLTFLVPPEGGQSAEEDDYANEGVPGMETDTPPIDQDPAPVIPAAAGDKETLVAEHQTQDPGPRSAATSEAGVDTSALISFNFSVRITAEDASKLSPEQLQSVLDFAGKLRG